MAAPPVPHLLGNSNDAGVSELGSSPASPSPALPASGEGASPRFPGRRCLPQAK
jgi:hypothetical protein